MRNPQLIDVIPNEATLTNRKKPGRKRKERPLCALPNCTNHVSALSYKHCSQSHAMEHHYMMKPADFASVVPLGSLARLTPLAVTSQTIPDEVESHDMNQERQEPIYRLFLELPAPLRFAHTARAYLAYMQTIDKSWSGRKLSVQARLSPAYFNVTLTRMEKRQGTNKLNQPSIISLVATINEASPGNQIWPIEEALKAAGLKLG